MTEIHPSFKQCDVGLYSISIIIPSVVFSSSFPSNICFYLLMCVNSRLLKVTTKAMSAPPCQKQWYHSPITSRKYSSSVRKAVTDTFLSDQNDADYEAIPISLTFTSTDLFDCVLCAHSRIMSIAPYRAQITSFRIGKFFLGNSRSIMHLFSWRVLCYAPSPLLLLVFPPYLLLARRTPSLMTIRPF